MARPGVRHRRFPADDGGEYEFESDLSSVVEASWESGYDLRTDGEISKTCEEGWRKILGYRLWAGSRQPSRSPRTSYQYLPHQPRGPAGCLARRAWRTDHRYRICSAESETTWTGCCIYHEAAIRCLGRTKLGLWWDVLSEFWSACLSLIAVGIQQCHTLSTGLTSRPCPSASLLRLRFLIGAPSITTERPWQGYGVIKGDMCGEEDEEDDDKTVCYRPASQSHQFKGKHVGSRR
jgi:hypothetical protein